MNDSANTTIAVSAAADDSQDTSVATTGRSNILLFTRKSEKKSLSAQVPMQGAIGQNLAKQYIAEMKDLIVRLETLADIQASESKRPCHK